MKQYILSGHEPIPCEDILTWAKWYGKSERVVKQDEIGGVKISIVFLGLDHNYDNEGAPILFETMIFGGDHDMYMDRYSTWDEAEIGHEKAVNMVIND